MKQFYQDDPALLQPAHEPILQEFSKTFEVIRNIDEMQLLELTDREIRPIIPTLVRMALCENLDHSESWNVKKEVILRKILGISMVESIVELLSFDCVRLEADLKKELQLRSKTQASLDSFLLPSADQRAMCVDFERSDKDRRMRIVIYEFLNLCSRDLRGNDQMWVQSELFDSDHHFDEVSDVLCIIHAELPELFSIANSIETLMKLRSASKWVQKLVLNFPDSFEEVCLSLIIHGKEQKEDSRRGKIRIKTIRLLSAMNADQILINRDHVVDNLSMPGLAVLLSLDAKNEPSNFVAFVSGLLFGRDEATTYWFSNFIRVTQKETGDTPLKMLRSRLLSHLNDLIEKSKLSIPVDYVLEAGSMLRLYCALNALYLEKNGHESQKIGHLHFTAEESRCIMEMITSKTPSSCAGVRFINLGLSILMACPSLVQSVEQQCKVTEWLHELLKSKSYFEINATNPSFIETMLILAINFRSNKRIETISGMIRNILGMNVRVRSTNLEQLKIIFVQKVFTERVVASHAVGMSVTRNLNRNMNTGIHPVHCIHQLLKSNAFARFGIPIKDWIYRQICNASTPLHPILPDLIKDFAISTLNTTGLNPHAIITEEEILAVFKKAKGARKRVPTPNSNSLTSQLLLVYYLLTYEELRLDCANPTYGRNAKKYSQALWECIPIYNLVQLAQKDMDNYSDIFPSLLRLLTSQFPSLCQAEDWMNNRHQRTKTDDLLLKIQHSSSVAYTSGTLWQSIQMVRKNYFPLLSHLEYLNCLPLNQLEPFIQPFVEGLPLLLEDPIAQSSFHETIKEDGNQLDLNPSSASEGKDDILEQPVNPDQTPDAEVLDLDMRKIEEAWGLECTAPTLDSRIADNSVPMDVEEEKLTKANPTDSNLSKSEILNKNALANANIQVEQNNSDTNNNQVEDYLNLNLNELVDNSRKRFYIRSLLSRPPPVMPVKNRIPLLILRMAKEVWFRFNAVLPRQLWAMTLKVFLPPQNSFPDNSDHDPLQILMCDQRVFRSAPILEIFLYLLRASLETSRTDINRRHLERTIAGKSQTIPEGDLNKIQRSLVLSQESAALQILLEICLPSEEEKHKPEAIQNLKIIQNLICQHLHQVFIKDTILVKLIHFQGYSLELLPLTTFCIPSMHTCLDFIKDMLGEGEMERKLFAIVLTSHLCLKYPIPKSLSLAVLCFNVSYTFLETLESLPLVEYFRAVLPSLTRMCQSFNPLCQDLDAIIMRLCIKIQPFVQSASEFSALNSLYFSVQEARERLRQLSSELCPPHPR